MIDLIVTGRDPYSVTVIEVKTMRDSHNGRVLCQFKGLSDASFKAVKRHYKKELV